MRSFLFVPGDRPERFDKAVASGAHVTRERDVARSRRWGMGGKLCIHRGTWPP